MEREPGLINGNSNQTSKWDTLSDVEFSSKASPNSLNNPDAQWAYDIDAAAERPNSSEISTKPPRPEILSAKHQRAIMDSIPAPTDMLGGLERVVEDLQTDNYQSGILARMNRLGLEGGNLLKPRHLEDFLTTFPYPDSFDEYSNQLLERIQQDSPQEADNYAQAMHDFKYKVYGPRQAYFEQMQAVEDLFDDTNQPSTQANDSLSYSEPAPDANLDAYDYSEPTPSDTHSEKALDAEPIDEDDDGIQSIPGFHFANYSEQAPNSNAVHQPNQTPSTKLVDGDDARSISGFLFSNPAEQHQTERSAEWAPGVSGVAQVSRSQVRNNELSDTHNADDSCQDSYLTRDDLGIFGVFDGVGGEANGAAASRTAAATLNWACDKRKISSGHDLAEILNQANLKVQEATDETGYTTATVAKIIEQPNGQKQLAYAHVGDTRIYLVHPDGTTEQITEDEGYENKITNYLGGDRWHENPAHKFGEIPVTPGDRVVLCSDGITGDRGSDLMSNEELGNLVINARTPEEASRDLVTNARKTDDRTAVVFGI